MCGLKHFPLEPGIYRREAVHRTKASDVPVVTVDTVTPKPCTGTDTGETKAETGRPAPRQVGG